MEQYPVWHLTGQIGTALVERVGLYAVVTATLTKAQGLLRLWLIGNDAPVLLGTPVPMGIQMQCRRKLSLRQIPPEIVGIAAWAGELGRWLQADGLYWRSDGRSLQIAEAYREGAPLRWVEKEAQLSTTRIEDVLCLVRQCAWQEWISEQYDPGTP